MTGSSSTFAKFVVEDISFDFEFENQNLVILLGTTVGQGKKLFLTKGEELWKKLKICNQRKGTVF